MTVVAKRLLAGYIRLYAPHVEKCRRIVLGGVLVADHASLRKPPVVFELENKTHDILERISVRGVEKNDIVTKQPR